MCKKIQNIAGREIFDVVSSQDDFFSLQIMLSFSSDKCIPMKGETRERARVC